MAGISLFRRTNPLASSKKDLIVRILLILLVMFIPLLMATGITALQGSNIFRSVPLWSDETWWYAQYAAISEYGRPLGFFGYQGHTAYNGGTWGPWGMYPLLLPGLFVRIFGWGLHSFVYYNFFFLAVSALIFILLTRPTNSSLLKLAAANGLMYITIFYTMICMNEIIRYSVAIVLSGIMYRLIMEPDVSKTRNILRWTLIPLFLAYSTCFYTILGLFIPIYLLIMLRKQKIFWRVLITAPVSYFAITQLRGLNSSTCTPYITNTISFTPPTLKLKIMNFYYEIVGNLQNINPYHLINQAEASEVTTLLLWFCILLYALMGVLIWRVCKIMKNPEKKNTLAVTLVCLFILLCFWGGHVVLYNTTEWTFMRGCNTAVYCALFLCALMPKEEKHTWTTGVIICLTGFITFLAVFPQFSQSARFSSDIKEAQWAETRSALEEVIVLDKNAEDPWSNTVVLYGAEIDVIYCLPYGVGLNSPISGTINENARYVVVGSDFEDSESRDASIQLLLNSGHQVIYDENNLAVLENCSRTYS